MRFVKLGILVASLFVISLFFLHFQFLSFSIYLLDLHDIHLQDTRMSGQFTRVIYFSLIVSSVPILVDLSTNISKSIKPKYKIIAVSIILLMGILFWITRIYFLRHSFDAYSAALRGDIYTSIRIHDLKLNFYLGLGMIFGTIVSNSLIKSD